MAFKDYRRVQFPAQSRKQFQRIIKQILHRAAAQTNTLSRMRGKHHVAVKDNSLFLPECGQKGDPVRVNHPRHVERDECLKDIVPPLIQTPARTDKQAGVFHF